MSSTQKELQGLAEKWLDAHDSEVEAKGNLSRIRSEIADSLSNVCDEEVFVPSVDGRVLVLQFDEFKLVKIRAIESVGSYL